MNFALGTCLNFTKTYIYIYIYPKVRGARIENYVEGLARSTDLNRSYNFGSVITILKTSYRNIEHSRNC